MTILATETSRRNRSNSRYLTTSEAASLAGCSYMTITRAADCGDIECIKTAGGHRRCSVESVCAFFGLPLPDGFAAENENENESGRVVAVYARCSTAKQSNNLSRQVERLEQYVAENYAGCDYKVFSEIGSGINNERPQLSRLLDYILAGRVSVLLVEFGDRLSRSARSLIVRVCEKCGTEVIETKQGEQENKAATEQEEMLTDISAIMTVYSAKMHGKRGGLKTKFVASVELKTRVATLHAQGLASRQIVAAIQTEKHVCQNTGNAVSSFAVNRMLAEIKAELRTKEAENCPKAVKQFISRFCVVSKAKSVFAPPLYQTFAAFCEQAGFETISDKAFCNVLTEQGYKYERQATNKNLVIGLALKHNPAASQSRKRWDIVLPESK